MNFEVMSDLYLAGLCAVAMVGWLARELAIDIASSMRTRR
jgi:hypothetical protein